MCVCVCFSRLPYHGCTPYLDDGNLCHSLPQRFEVDVDELREGESGTVVDRDVHVLVLVYAEYEYAVDIKQARCTGKHDEQSCNHPRSGHPMRGSFLLVAGISVIMCDHF